jgi:DNA repair protein RadC
MATILADLPPHERPRERVLRSGLEALSERELLALVLRNGRGGESALELAGSLLGEYGTLSALANARIEELARRPGIGVAKASAIAAAFRLGRLAREPLEAPHVLRCAADVASCVASELASLRRERVVVLICNSANRVCRTVILSEGSIDRSLLSVRDILNAVLRHDGRAFAVAHNHPSGDPTPSEADRRATAELSAAATVVGLRFLDHVVVAGDRWRTVVT